MSQPFKRTLKLVSSSMWLFTKIEYLLKKAKSKKGKAKNGNEKTLAIEKVTRKDEALVKSFSLVNNLIAAAPDKKDGYVKVKAMF